MRADYWRQLRDSAEKYDLELLNAAGIRCQEDLVIAELALIDIDEQLRAAHHNLGTSLEVESGVMVTARRCTKNRVSKRYRNGR